MTLPLVSIIIPNYNHSKYLTQRIESVLNQTYRSFEVILMDDYSSDSSLEVLEKFEKHPKVSKILINEKNSGSTFKQWNKGVESARGKYIWLAESDDYAHECFLETLVPLLDSNQSVGLAFCQSMKVDGESQHLGEWKYPKELLDKDGATTSGIAFLKKFNASSNSIPNASAVLFRKRLFDEVGKANTNYKINGDWLLWIRLLLKADIVFLNKTLNFFRFHPNNVRSQTKANIAQKERLAVYQYVVNNVQFEAKEKKAFMYNIIHFIMKNWFPILEFREKKYIYTRLRKMDKYVLPKILKTYLTLKFRK